MSQNLQVWIVNKQVQSDPKEMRMMKIVIFGAAGATGRIVVERALAQGHEVKAFDRNMAALKIEHPKL